MTVRAIKTANFRCSCGKCKSQLEYKYTDIGQHKTNTDYTGGYDIVYGIECPICSSVVIHNNNNLPQPNRLMEDDPDGVGNYRG